ncbi:hypothetical protein SUGI_0037340 [Cryptomeria japonica]|uniref:alpha pinene synthase, chloroplastic n=1 Tax=Cryptomeria japonica TaxID=3369 RepID=UPI002408E973|nr:alpha pinene synthase, chloroplastic [Cryptomeria japonica]GLJ06369.1 hypothetical protein SUGI_0037340 [Cryptomeria japonica]
MALSSALSLNWSFSLSPQPTQSLMQLKRFSKTLPFMCTKKLQPIVDHPLAKVEIPFQCTSKQHSNLWRDDFLQPIPMHPYKAPSYAEHSGRLITDIKGMFHAIAAGDPHESNVFQLLEMVDNIERLGIGRHFRTEITDALDFIYRNWGECQGDLNTTALGFRILRLHKYPVSSGILGPYKTENGQFLCSTAESEEEKIKGILNLYRASQIAFPGEKILEEAKDFCVTYLSEALQKTGISSHLLKEISFNLENGRYTNLPRLEARKYIKIYGENSSWARMDGNKKILTLAQMDFNMIQLLHQEERKAYSRWWRDSGLSKLKCAHRRYIEYFSLACAICEDEKYAKFRSGIAKFSAIATYLADTYNTYGTYDELKQFTDAIKKWDPTSTDYLPKYMRIIYTALYEAINEMDVEVRRIQGRDTLSASRDAWQSYIDVMMQEVEWRVSQEIPILKKYLENGKVSSIARVVTLQPILTIDGILPEKIFQNFDYPSRFNDHVCLILKLTSDIKSFKGKVEDAVSSKVCYMRDNPGSTKEDAFIYINNLLDEQLKELSWEYLKFDNVPSCDNNYAYDITRGFLHFYQEEDGFSISSEDIKNHINQILDDYITK